MLKQENHMTSKQHPTHADTDRSYSSAVNMIAQAQREVNWILCSLTDPFSCAYNEEKRKKTD